MRIRIAKRHVTPKGELKPGDVIEVRPWVAEDWIGRGIAMLDKAYEPRETKVVSSAPNSAGALIMPHRVGQIITPRRRGG